MWRFCAKSFDNSVNKMGQVYISVEFMIISNERHFYTYESF